MKSFSPLPQHVAARRRAQPPTYRPAELYRLPQLRASRVLDADFDTAAAGLRGWRVQASVFRVRATGPALPGAVVELGFGLGPLVKKFYCRVTDVIDETDRCGFTYGTLPGHLERGAETFTLTRLPGNRARLDILARSEPATWWLRLARPVIDLARRALTSRRYLRALI